MGVCDADALFPFRRTQVMGYAPVLRLVRFPHCLSILAQHSMMWCVFVFPICVLCVFRTSRMAR